MDALDLLVQQIDEKVTGLKDWIAKGSLQSYDEYQKLCGEITGLLTARGYILDLRKNLENSDE